MQLIFDNPIIKQFKNRYKRFFIDMTDGTTIYCPNPGKMADILIENSDCILTANTDNIPLKIEAIKIEDIWIGVNTQNPNKIAELLLPYLFPGEVFKKEVCISKNYRCDFASENKIIEVKNVHWKINNTAFFPDCPTLRGAKQMLELSELTKQYECYVIYIVQRNDCNQVSIADFIDQTYFNNHSIAKQNGLKILAFSCYLDITGITIYKQIPFI